MRDTLPILGRFVDDLLHVRNRMVTERRDHFVVIGLVLMLLGGGVFGAALGAYGEVRPAQMLYSAIKVPLLLGLSFLLTIPSFYVVNAVLGTHREFASCLRALLATQIGMTLFLASLAPFTLFWYASGSSYASAKLFNLVLFAAAAWYGWIVLRRYYRPLIERNRMHAHLVKLWIVQFAFIAVQLTWVLRPFIGNPERPTGFLRDDAWGNAYLQIGRLITRALTG